MNIRMPQVVKEHVEEELRSILYEEKTLELLDSTIEHLREILGDGYITAYLPSKNGEVKFLIAKRIQPTFQYTVWTVSLAPAKWEPSDPPIDESEGDESEQGENVNGDEPPVPDAEG